MPTNYLIQNPSKGIHFAIYNMCLLSQGGNKKQACLLVLGLLVLIWSSNIHHTQKCSTGISFTSIYVARVELIDSKHTSKSSTLVGPLSISPNLDIFAWPGWK